MTLFSLPSRLCRAMLPALFLIVGTLSASMGVAQTIYGIGSAAGAGPFDTIYTINPANGAATAACGPIAGFTSAAIGVNNADGLIYAFSQAGPPTTVRAIDPSSCAVTTPPNTQVSVGNIIRAASCPDGRFYIMSNTAQFFEIIPSTGVTVRTLTWTGLTAGGSGDFTCASNNTMYIIAADGVANYNLYSAPAASFSAVPSGSAVAVTNVGDVGLAGAPNGIAEAPLGGVGCAASPTPCLVASTGATLQTWGINATTAVATNLGASSGITLTDLSRSFPVDLSVVKTVTPTVALQGQTVVYTLNVSNSGPASVGKTTVTDTLSAAFASAVWSCSVNTAGTPTSVPTACGSPSGSGSINTSASFSLGGSIIYRVTATLSSTFTGTATNVAVATMTGAITDPNPSNNISTVTSTVSPATSLSISKTNGTTTLVAGQTTSYTVTVSNLGPGDAPNAVAKDPAAAGLSCTTASCTTTGTATCPAGTPAAILTALQSGAGATIPTLNSGATVSFLVTCGVTATGQ
jgi:uncharacterized repeat protein (TIGR01451 family)